MAVGRGTVTCTWEDGRKGWDSSAQGQRAPCLQAVFLGKSQLIIWIWGQKAPTTASGPWRPGQLLSSECQSRQWARVGMTWAGRWAEGNFWPWATVVCGHLATGQADLG